VRYPETDDCTLHAGDLILVSATAAELVEMLGHGAVAPPEAGGQALPEPYDLDTQIVEDTVPRVINRTRAPVALAIFVAMVAAASFGVVNILTAALTACGAADLYARGFLSLFRHPHRLPDQPAGIRSGRLPFHRLPAPRHGAQRGGLGDGRATRAPFLAVLSLASRRP